MIDELATHISLLAAPIFSALLRHGRPQDLEDPEWQARARAAAIRQAMRLWEDALAALSANCARTITAPWTGTV